MKKSLLILALLSAQSAFSADLFFTMKQISPKIDESFQTQVERFEKACGNSIKMDVQKLVSNRREIDAQINRNIATQADVNAYYKRIITENLREIDGNLENRLIIFSCGRELTYTPQYIGHYKNIEQFKVSHYEKYYFIDSWETRYAANDYYLFDENNQRLTLKVLLEDNSKEKFDALLKEKFYQILVELLKRDSQDDNQEKNIQDIEDAAKNLADEYFWDIERRTDNFFFTEKSIIFSYSRNVQGLNQFEGIDSNVNLEIPYTDLKGILKAQYLL